MPRRRIPSLRKDERGASLVEMTLVTPLVLALAAGMAEFGTVMYQHQLIETGVRDAARFLSRRPDPSADAVLGQRLAATGVVTTGGVNRVSWWNVGDVSVSVVNIANPLVSGERTYRGPDPIRVVRVSTTATYPGVGLLRALAITTGLTVRFTHEERVVGE
jgi:hypothetical protein